MSMINISGIPNMGFAGGGGGYFAPSGLGQLGYNDLSYYGGGKAGVGADQALYNNIFGNFGQQTDYYSGLGAAYGRQTGGFGAPGSNPGWQDPGAPAAGYDPFSPGYGGQGAGMSSVFDQGIYGAKGAVPPAPDFNSTFANYGIYSPNQGANQSAYDYMRSMQGWGVQPPQYQAPQSPPPSMQELYGGYNPFAQYANGGYNPFDSSTYSMAPRGGGGTAAAPYNPWAQQNPSPFFSAFSQFPGNATPSQYTYQPYTNAQGQTFQPNLPQGFAPEYGVDNPQGALGTKAWQNPFGENQSGAGG